MRFLHALASNFYRSCISLIGLLTAVVMIALPFIWQAPAVAKLITVRSIGVLKRIYRESYDTNGQSLDHRWRAC